MCGIVGIYSKRGGAAAERVAGALGAIAHRGPDGEGVWVARDGRAALGHRRLAVIDLEGGAQPIASEDESLRVVVNGELYDYQEIARQLTARGHTFRTRTDSEIVLHLYEERGLDALHALRGEFAFLLWDGGNDTLIAARDRFGIKPLYYAEIGGDLLLASEVKALFALGVGRCWDLESVHQYAHLYLEQDRTLYRDVRQVPPGHALVCRGGVVRVVPYWDIIYPEAGGVEERSDGEWIEAVRAALLDAVKTRLRADVPVGCYLSGGLDSSALCGIVAAGSSTRVEAFSICFDAEPFNEGRVAEATARHVGAAFHPLRLDERKLADSFEDAAAHAEMPMPNAAGIARYLLSRHVRERGIKVVLSGEGADEVFLGYPYMRKEVFQVSAGARGHADGSAYVRALESSLPVDRAGAGRPASLSTVERTLGYLPAWMETRTLAEARHRSLFASALTSRLAQRNPYRAFLDGIDVQGRLRGREAVNQSVYLWMKCMFPNLMLCWIGDRAEMAHSIEGRQPFLDHPLVELAARLPTRLKIAERTEKHVLREAARPYLTQDVYERQKFMFQAPPPRLERGAPLFEALCAAIHAGLPHLSFYDRAGVEAFMDAAPGTDPADRVRAFETASTLMTIAGFAVLAKRYGIGDAR